MGAVSFLLGIYPATNAPMPILWVKYNTVATLMATLWGQLNLYHG